MQGEEGESGNEVSDRFKKNGNSFPRDRLRWVPLLYDCATNLTRSVGNNERHAGLLAIKGVDNRNWSECWAKRGAMAVIVSEEGASEEARRGASEGRRQAGGKEVN